MEFGYLGIGIWEVNDQTIQYFNDQQTNPQQLKDRSTSICVKRDKNLFDFIYVATVKFVGSGSAGLVFRFQNPTNYYLVQLVQVIKSQFRMRTMMVKCIRDW